MKVITEFANRISKKMVNRGIVKEEDVELYQYGIESGIMKEIFSFRVFFIVGITALVIILALSPVESPNKPLDKDEWKYYRRISQLIASIQVCVLVFLFCWGNFPYFYAGYSSFILIALFMLMGKIASMHYI